jgi:hypothetical protein
MDNHVKTWDIFCVAFTGTKRWRMGRLKKSPQSMTIFFLRSWCVEVLTIVHFAMGSHLPSKCNNF